MVNLVKKEIITKGPLARGAKQRHHLTGLCRDQCYNSWKNVPTIKYDQDSYLIGVWIIEQETISIGISVLVENQSTTDMLRDSIDMVFKQRSDLDTKRIHQEQHIE